MRMKYHEAYEKTQPYPTYSSASLECSFVDTAETLPPILDTDAVMSHKVMYQDIKGNEFNCFSQAQREAILAFKKELLAQVAAL